MDSLSSAPGADLLVPYSYPPSLSAMRVTPSGLHTIYKGFLQFRRRGLLTRSACFRRGTIAALPQNVLFTKDLLNFVSGRSLLASSVAFSDSPGALRAAFVPFFGFSPLANPLRRRKVAPPFGGVGCGALQESWREYVRALKKVAHTYGVPVEGVSQMMSPAKARALWKKLCRKTHPDKGGNPAHLREITDAKGKWENLLKQEGQAAP